MNTTTNETANWSKVCWDVGHKTATDTAANYTAQGYIARVVSVPGFGWDCEIIDNRPLVMVNGMWVRQEVR